MGTPIPGGLCVLFAQYRHLWETDSGGSGQNVQKHAVKAHGSCADVPLKLHAHQFRHAKASHWLEDGMNIVQISFLLGHEQLDTTMVYLDITTEDEAKALATLEGEGDSKVEKKWKNSDGSLREFCGLPAKRS